MRVTLAKPIVHGLSTYNNEHCRCETCRRAKTASSRQYRAVQRDRRLTDLVARYVAADPVRVVFRGLRCSDCGHGLHDPNGEPRWEILWPMRFVCVGGCQDGAR